MPKLPWVKWFPSDWLSEPGLAFCDVATQGVWANALNAMMLSGTGSISGTDDQLARLCRCRLQQIQLAKHELKKFKVAEITVNRNSTTLACRRLVREHEIRELRKKAGSKGLAKRWQTPQQDVIANRMANSASAYAYASNSQGEGSGERGDRWENNGDDGWPWDSAKAWLAQVRSNGADYTEAETRSAFLALQANGWRWGKNPVADPRAALERQIQTDRSNLNTKTANANNGNPGRKRTDANQGTANDGKAHLYAGAGRRDITDKPTTPPQPPPNSVPTHPAAAKRL